ncbi:hypothetical protein DPMN_187842 [Dreissena polymorpha]|uniref:Uncharacterized protein n=1 Tax=Dreissena polymorpha TaxID=45954 RepID=A0A9D4DQ85_DREPO|nr:hypothetical protein DPMN_187842 [Dreissena polymorpha]
MYTYRENVSLLTAGDAELASHILPTLSKLETLYLMGKYTGLFAIQLSESVQFIDLLSVECSTEWLCSLLIHFSASGNPIKCYILSIVQTSIEEPCNAVPNMHASVLRSKLLACDMSYIEICVIYGNKELFETFRDTSIGILDLQTADCI